MRGPRWSRGSADCATTREILALDPQLPDGIERLCFRLRWRGFRVTVEAGHDEVTYTLRDGPDATLTIRHAGERLELNTQSPSTVTIRRRTPLLPTPPQPPGREPFRRSASGHGREVLISARTHGAVEAEEPAATASAAAAGLPCSELAGHELS